MKILLAPSEAKINGGENKFDINSLLFPQLNKTRLKLLNEYQATIDRFDTRELSKMFGLKKEKDIQRYLKIIKDEPTIKAIKRYTGVAFDYLDYDHLPHKAQQYIDREVILCSNLFGFLRASDEIPNYRLKQGETVGSLQPEKLYKEQSSIVDSYLEQEEILDLRASFYEKFYKPKKNYTTLKFIKDGKVVSHWAKAYRGIVLRNIAIARVETLDAFMNLPIEGLSIDEIQTKKNKTEIIYTINS